MNEYIISIKDSIDRLNYSINSLIELYQVNKKQEEDLYLRSIKEISAFVGCSDATSQKIKNDNPEIFTQTGRKFIVKISDLTQALKKKRRGRHA